MVGQAGIGLASEREKDVPLCFLGCATPAAPITGPWLPALTGSVAGGIASRRSGTTVLSRVEGDSGGNVALLPMIEQGG